MKGTAKMSEIILETRNLTKKYRNQYALKDVSISLKKNHIYGFIGENGAGKSTLMKIVAGLIFPTDGDMKLMGESDPAAIEKKRKLVGTMIEGPYMYPGYTVRQNVELQRLLVGNPDESATDRIIEMVGLGDSKKKKAKKLSMGMKQRLGIAMALIGNPKLLILDEPINGLDPKNIVTLRNMLKQIRDDNDCTIFVSSHILSELYLLATDFIFILTIVEKHFPGTSYKVESDDEIKIYGKSEIMAELSGYLMNAGILVSELSIKEITLEDYFMSITGGDNNA